MTKRFLVTIFAAGLLLGAVESASASYHLERGEATTYMRIGLSRQFPSFGAGYAKRVSCRKRISRDTIRCKRISWNVGDVGYKGQGTIWVTYPRRGKPQWNYKYRITMTDYYCINSGGSHCRKKFVEK